MSFRESHKSSESISFCAPEFCRGKNSDFYKIFKKGSVTQKIRNHCSGVSNPVTISGAFPHTGKRETYLSTFHTDLSTY